MLQFKALCQSLQFNAFLLCAQAGWMDREWISEEMTPVTSIHGVYGGVV